MRTLRPTATSASSVTLAERAAPGLGLRCEGCAAAIAQSPLGNAGEAQAFAIPFAVACVLERVHAREALHGEVRFEGDQLFDIRPCLVGPPEMAERRDQRLVARAEVRIRFDGSAPDERGLFVVALEGVSQRVD